MKKIFIAVLLIAAAGAGVYYFYFGKKKHSIVKKINQELITGKWKIDSLSVNHDSSGNAAALWLFAFALDSNAKNRVYDFQNTGKVFVSLPEDSTAKPDTAAFAWKNENVIAWKENLQDSTGAVLTVTKLDRQELVLQSKDSVKIYLKKIR